MARYSEAVCAVKRFWPLSMRYATQARENVSEAPVMGASETPETNSGAQKANSGLPKRSRTAVTS